MCEVVHDFWSLRVAFTRPVGRLVDCKSVSRLLFLLWWSFVRLDASGMATGGIPASPPPPTPPSHPYVEAEEGAVTECAPLLAVSSVLIGFLHSVPCAMPFGYGTWQRRVEVGHCPLFSGKECEKYLKLYLKKKKKRGTRTSRDST